MADLLLYPSASAISCSVLPSSRIEHIISWHSTKHAIVLRNYYRRGL